jgi:hypothetical protein
MQCAWPHNCTLDRSLPPTRTTAQPLKPRLELVLIQKLPPGYRAIPGCLAGPVGSIFLGIVD